LASSHASPDDAARERIWLHSAVLAVGWRVEGGDDEGGSQGATVAGTWHGLSLVAAAYPSSLHLPLGGPVVATMQVRSTGVRFIRDKDGAGVAAVFTCRTSDVWIRRHSGSSVTALRPMVGRLVTALDCWASS
jgi:hypothetical protein